jgi:hypothetical protein
MATVVLAYWAPIYVTVDTDAREVVEIRVVRTGLRSGSRISGQASPNGVEREAARVFSEALADTETLADGRLPAITIR